MREVDRESRTPAWQQIAGHLRAEIAAGKYDTGAPLPSIAALVQVWGVNRKTAAKALKALVDEGLIEVEPGMGHYLRR